MKKTVLVVLALLVLSTVAFSQNSVNEYNGFNWVTWSYDMKIGYIRGFYSAYVSVLELLAYKNKDNENFEEYMKEAYNQFFIPLNVSEMGEKIDKYYDTYANRKFYLWQVTVMFAGKGWWEE